MHSLVLFAKFKVMTFAMLLMNFLLRDLLYQKTLILLHLLYRALEYLDCPQSDDPYKHTI